MRHVFILNPAAGKRNPVPEICEQIKAYFALHPEASYTIHVTGSAGEASEIARRECEMGDAVRLYACGGDGTLQETANGIPVGSTAELTVIPCGSGNDYVRTFGGREWFLNLPDLIEGEAFSVDGVDCGERRSLNIASIGMDAAVCAKMLRYKHLPFVNGSLAYQLAIVDVFCHPIGEHMDITIETPEGVIHRSGKYLLALAANGRYYGGGYHGAPQAVEDDGILDFVLIRKIARLRIPFFLNLYKQGRYGHLPFCEHIRGFAMQVRSARPTYCNVDGECTYADSMDFRILPDAYRFVLPKTLAEARKKARAVTEKQPVSAFL